MSEHLLGDTGDSAAHTESVAPTARAYGSAPTIALLGDIHGDALALQAAHDRAVQLGAVALIQVGDFGVYDFTRARFAAVSSAFTIPVYFIDGNHEDYRLIREWPCRGRLVEWAPNCWWVPRGEVLVVAGYRVGCLGGAASIDFNFRKAGHDWFPDDEITKQHEADRLRGQRVDLLVTHTPPQCVIDRHFDPRNKIMFGAGMDWSDPSAKVVDDAWAFLGYPPLVCGHMHRAVTDGACRILDIAEMLLWRAPVSPPVGAQEPPRQPAMPSSPNGEAL